MIRMAVIRYFVMKLVFLLFVMTPHSFFLKFYKVATKVSNFSLHNIHMKHNARNVQIGSVFLVILPLLGPIHCLEVSPPNVAGTPCNFNYCSI